MEKLILIALLPALLLSGPAMANPVLCGGNIAPYGGTVGYNCKIYDSSPGFLYAYIIHGMFTGPREGAIFAAPKPDCMADATYLFESLGPGMIGIGNTQTGIHVAYGGCKTEPVVVATIVFMGMGTTPDCCEYWVVPHPDSAAVETIDCDGNNHEDWGGVSFVNPDPALCQTPTVPSTWGEIKSLYR